MNRPSEKDRTPQTFDEWREAWVPAESGHNFDSYGMRAAWDAALASQQAEGDQRVQQMIGLAHDRWVKIQELEAELRTAREALQQITWHIGCSEVKRGGLPVSEPSYEPAPATDAFAFWQEKAVLTPWVISGQFCPGCIARHALDRLTTSEDKAE